MRAVCLSVCAVLSVAGSAGSAMAQTDVTWSNPAGGAWGNAANWSPAVVPNNVNGLTYNALLSSVGGAYVVAMGTNNTIENFTMDEALAVLNLTTRTLTVNEGFTADAGLITSSGGSGQILVAGEVVFGDVMMMGAGQVKATGGMNIQPTINLEICDTDVDYGGVGGGGGVGGQAATWEGNNSVTLDKGGTLNNGSDSLFQVSPDGDKLLTGDGTGTLNNEGELVLLDAPASLRAGSGKVVLGLGLSERGGASVDDTLRVDGASFVNQGGVTVLRGGLNLAEVVNDQTSDGELNRGRWTISVGRENVGRVVFPGRDAVFNINTRVTLLGEGSSFPAIDGVSIIGSNGRFEIGDNRNFGVQDSLAVIGEVVVGSGSVFDASTGLDNIGNGLLSNGAYTVSGTLLVPSFESIFAITECSVRLIGPNAAFPAINSLQVIAGGGVFSLEQGRNFETQGSLQVLPGGLLRIGQGSALFVSQELMNAGNGALNNGAFEIGGALVSGLNPVSALLNTRLALYGPNSMILGYTGADAIGALSYVGPNATLEVREGRVLITAQPFTVDGTLVVDPASAVNPVPGGLIEAPLTQFETTDAMFVNKDSEVRIGVTSSSGSGVGTVQADKVIFENGEAGTLRVRFAEDVELTLPFERSVVRSSNVNGEFATVVAEGLSKAVKMSVIYDGQTGVVIRVISACPADLNGDGVADNGDIGLFVEAFLKGDLAVDFNGDGVLDNGDIGAFVQHFLNGC